MLFWLVVCLVVALDQATKAAVMHLMPIGAQPRTLIAGVVDLVHIENSGAAFSMAQGATVFLSLIACAIFIAVLCSVLFIEMPLTLVGSLAAVAGGGAANMIDRVSNGTVTDFIATSFIDFPVFNVADIFVTCGVCASLIFYLRWEARSAEKSGHNGAFGE